MALSNYSDIKASISSWAARDDLTSLIPDFIAIAENRIARDARIKAMENALSSTIASGVIAVPSGYLELKHAYIDGSSAQWLQRKDPEWIYANYATRSADSKPKFIAREGDNFIFGAYPDSAYTVKGIYYAKLTPLSDSNTTNWFTDNAPELIVYGALVELFMYLQDIDQATAWLGRYNEVLSMIKRQDEIESLSGSALSVMSG